MFELSCVLNRDARGTARVVPMYITCEYQQKIVGHLKKMGGLQQIVSLGTNSHKVRF